MNNQIMYESLTAFQAISGLATHSRNLINTGDHERVLELLKTIEDLSQDGIDGISGGGGFSE